MSDLIVTILSSVAVSAVLTSALVWLSKTWISTRLKNAIKHEYDQKLETHKASLTRDFAKEIEMLKGQISKALEQEKKVLDERFRRHAHFFDKNAKLYETFHLEYGSVLTELYALEGDWIDKLNTLDPRLGVEVRASFLLRAHGMLIQAQEKLAPQQAYLDTELSLRIASLFANLSAFMAEGAKDRKRLDELALEKALVSAELRSSLMGSPDRSDRAGNGQTESTT